MFPFSSSPLSPSARLHALRQSITSHPQRLTAFLVPSEDAHQSEYPQAQDQRRAWISGFKGSAGTGLVFAEGLGEGDAGGAKMWTDGRYWEAAGKELNAGWGLMKMGMSGVPSLESYLSTLSPPHSHSTSTAIDSARPTTHRIGLDPTLISISSYLSLSKLLQESGNGTELVLLNSDSNSDERNTTTVQTTPINLIDQLWTDRLPSSTPTSHTISIHPELYSGESALSKIEKVRKMTGASEAEGGGKKWGVVLSCLDEIAWMLNLRLLRSPTGQFLIPNSPTFPSYLLLGVSHAPVLFIDDAFLGPEVVDAMETSTEGEAEGSKKEGVRDYLNALGVIVRPYEEVEIYLRGVAKELSAGETLLLPPKTNLSLANAIGLEKIWVDKTGGPVVVLKSLKNEVEIAGFHSAHTRDGIALVRYFSWLERRLASDEKDGKGEKGVTEWEAAEVLEGFRSELPLFKGLSFPTISSTGPNASIIHYQPTAEKNSVIRKDQIYLCDSGAQYLDGTTDTTRTLHYGVPTDEEVRAYTRVLQGHIAIDTCVFPKGTTGYLLDAFARKALWSDGLDYRHGTSHGVGSFLNVHEGPQGVGTRISYNDVKLQAGQTLSNEPGCYIEGKFGIRIENVVVCVPANPQFDFGNTGWLKFSNFTQVPISTNLVDVTLLTPAELKWLNDYNEGVRNILSTSVEATGDMEALAWLVRECRPVGV